MQRCPILSTVAEQLMFKAGFLALGSIYFPRLPASLIRETVAFAKGSSKLGAALQTIGLKGFFYEKEVIHLKEGAIICIDGKTPDKWTEGDEADFRKQLTNFETVQFVTPQAAPFLLQRLWLKMISKGITDLVVAMAKFGKTGKLELSGKRVRLPIVGMS